ncbi:hypothetical protein HHI36_015596, partial [Cryptolaemus montrouzieri]
MDCIRVNSNNSPHSCSIEAETLSLPVRDEIGRCRKEGKEESSCFATKPRVLKTDEYLSPTANREAILA